MCVHDYLQGYGRGAPAQQGFQQAGQRHGRKLQEQDGDTNFLIVNALRKLEEERETAQRAALEVAEQGAQAEQPPPPS